MEWSGRIMDLFALFSKTYHTLKSNVLLFLPPLINIYLIPVALAIAAAYVFVPILVVATETGRLLSGMAIGVILGLLVLGILALVMYSAVVAGWGNMNRFALTRRKTYFGDFKSGFNKYFGRVVAAVVITVVVLLALALVGLATILSIGLPWLRRVVERMPGQGVTAPIAGEPLEILARVMRFAARSGGVVLGLLTLAGLWLLFTLFWIPAIIVSDLGLFSALSRSFSFVKRNFHTVIGYAGLYIIAERFTRTIFPGGAGGGGGGGIGAGYGFGFGIVPALEGVFQVLIQAFFILLLYAIYIDRTRGRR